MKLASIKGMSEALLPHASTPASASWHRSDLGAEIVPFFIFFLFFFFHILGRRDESSTLASFRLAHGSHSLSRVVGEDAKQDNEEDDGSQYRYCGGRR